MVYDGCALGYYGPKESTSCQMTVVLQMAGEWHSKTLLAAERGKEDLGSTENGKRLAFALTFDTALAVKTTSSSWRCDQLTMTASLLSAKGKSKQMRQRCVKQQQHSTKLHNLIKQIPHSAHAKIMRFDNHGNDRRHQSCKQHHVTKATARNKQDGIKVICWYDRPPNLVRL